MNRETIMNKNIQLFDYQEKCLKWMLQREASKEAPGGILSLDMGLGKTIMIISIICQNPSRTLVVVPKNLVSQWVSEFEKFSNFSIKVVNAFDSNKNNVEFEDEKIVIVPTSLFSSMTNEDENVFLSQKFDRIVVDEAHLIRNRKTKSYKLISMIDSRVKWLLSGTPVVKNDENFKTLLEFIQIYSVSLKYAARNFVYRLAKEDAFDMPPLVIEDLRSDFMFEEERVAYEEIIHGGRSIFKAYKAYGNGESRMEILKVLLRLRQMTTNINITPDADDEEKKYSGQSTKIELLKNDILSSPVQKTLIFCHFHEEMNAIAQMLNTIGHECVFLHGKVSQDQREHYIQQFTNLPNVNFFIIQIDAGGVGLNLQISSRIYINSLHWNGTSELQAIGRSHRIGQKKPVTVKRLIINNTIDEAILGLQQKKLSVAAELFDDHRIKNSLISKKTSSDFKTIVDTIFG